MIYRKLGEQQLFLRLVEKTLETKVRSTLLHVELGLDAGDLLLDTGLALVVGKLGLLVLLRLGSPVLRLLSRAEVGVLTDRLVGVLVDLLNVLAANVVVQVRREVLLEALVILLLK